MMELTLFLQLGMVFFATMGYQNGIYREFIAFMGIITGLFVLSEFDWLLNFVVPRGITFRFIVQAILLVAITFFSYQQAPTRFVPTRYRGRRGPDLPTFQGIWMRLAAAILGAFNGYLVIGAFWYFMDQYEYPLEPLIMMPALGTGSANFVGNLPLVWLGGDVLLIAMAVVLFVIFIFR